MKGTTSTYHVGDCVRVKAGVKDPDWGKDLGGWQGRISGIDKDGDEVVVNIQWDSITLKNMPAAMIEQ